MSMLTALDGYYGRMAARGEAEPPGWSREKISFAIVLDTDGTPRSRIDLRETSGRKQVPRLLEVPAGAKRTVAILPNLFWDKTAYALGRTAGTGKRTAEEHAAFRKQHLDLLAEATDPGLVALRRFLEGWAPARFDAPPFQPDMLDANIVFALDGERAYIHERPAARRLVESRQGEDGPRGFCLVTGEEASLRRLHPVIKGVEGAQTSGAALVSFNLDAFESYGKAQGENAPTSEAAAFRYGAALNRLLDRGSANRLPRPIGDTTVVFWADASTLEQETAAQVADSFFGSSFNTDTLDLDAPEAQKLRDALQRFAEGRPIADVDPRIDPAMRFHILGLAPNAARLSIRFWLTDSFGAFAERLRAHYEALRIEPLPYDWGTPGPSVARLLVRTTALLQKFDNIPPQLAGEVTRAVLSGTPYPRTLLAAALIRLRAGDDPATGWHAAAIRAVLARLNKEETPPLALEREHDNAAYQLGRMFAMAEIAQRMALGKVNATIRDRYFGAASATPASVFPLILRGMQNHVAKLRKDNKGGFIEREMDQIAVQLPPQLPRALRLEEQGKFVIGYYHQRKARIGGKPVDEIAEAETPEENENG